MAWLVQTVPTSLLGVLIIGLSIALAAGGTLVIRRRIPEEAHARNNEVAGFIFAVVGVVYGIVLGFLVLAVWQDYQEARAAADHEAAQALNLYRLAKQLPAPHDQELAQGLVMYARAVIRDEWPRLSGGEISAAAQQALDGLWEAHGRLDTTHERLSTFHQEAFDLLVALGDDRHERILAGRDDLPPILWLLLLGGGLVTIGYSFFFRTPSASAHMLMTGMLAAMVGFVLFLIISLDDPFAGDIHVPPTALEQVLAILENDARVR